MAKTDVKSMTLEELQLFMGELGEPKFRAKQIFDWLHQKQVDTFAEMTNLSQKLRERLEQEAKIGGVEMVERFLSKEDGTRKYLFALENGSIIESVLMQYDYGNTVCVSTQAGCRMGLQILRFYIGRRRKKPDTGGNAFSGLHHSEGFGTADFRRGAHGQRRTAG